MGPGDTRERGTGTGVPARVREVGVLLLLLGVALGMVPHHAAAAPPWQPVGSGSLNINPATAVSSNDLTTVGTTPHALWTEGGDIRSKRWNGTSWVAVGARINGAGTGAKARIASDGTRPWVTYLEDVAGVNQVFVRQWTGAAWTLRGGALNVSGSTVADAPDIAHDGTSAYAVWRENAVPPVGYVKRWNGSAWVSLGGVINADPTRDLANPSIALDGTTPWVTFQQWNGTAWQINVRRWNGSAWVTMGGSLNIDPTQNAWSPRIAIDAGTAWVAFREESAGGTRVRVRQWNGSSWVAIGGSANPYWTSGVDITIDAGTPYLAFGEWIGSKYMQVAARLTGGVWRQIGGTLNTTNVAGDGGAITIVSGEPWIAWNEDVGTARNVFVKRYAPNNSMVGNVRQVTAVAGTTTATLSWTNPPDAAFAGVRIYRSTVQGTLGTLAGTVLVGDAVNDQFSEAGLTANVTYYYTLVAYDTLGNERETAYQTGESFQTPRRYGGAMATNGTKMWTFGGCDSCVVRKDIWEYDPTTDEMVQLPGQLPTARVRSRGVWVGGSINKAFILGGDDATQALDDVVTFDPATGTSTEIGNMPGGRVEGAAAYSPDTGYIYYMGGADFARTTVYDTIFRINPATGASIDTGLKLPQATWRTNGIYWPKDRCIYSFGGDLAGGTKNDDIVRFCPLTGTVQTMTSVLPEGRAEITMAAGQDEIYIFGGYTTAYSDQVLGFIPEVDRIVIHPMRLPQGQIAETANVETNNSFYSAMSWPASHKVTQIAPGVVIRAHTSNPPNKPTNTAPANGGAVGAAVTLTSSAFSDPDAGDTHAASEWQVRTASGLYADAVWQTGADATRLTSATTDALADGSYRFRVRHRDDKLNWSAWSNETAFIVDTTAPLAPTHVAPASGTETGSQPVLQATYQDGASGTAGQLQYQVCSDSACTTVVDTGSSAAGLASGAQGSWTPAAKTAGVWYWRARGTDARGQTGPWSSTWSFDVAGTITLSVNAPSVSVGTLSPGLDGTATSVLTIGTDHPRGFAVSITDASDTLALTSGGNALRDWTGTNATPTVWTAGTSGADGLFGATVVATGGGAAAKLAKWGTGATANDFVNNKYAGVPQSTSLLLHTQSGAGSGRTVTVGWRANPSATTPSGTYSSTIAVTVVTPP